MTTLHTTVPQRLDPKINLASAQSKRQLYMELLATTTLINDDAPTIDNCDSLNLDLHIDLGLMLDDLKLGEDTFQERPIDDDKANDADYSLPSPDDMHERDIHSNHSINTSHLTKTHHTRNTQTTAYSKTSVKTQGTTQTSKTQRTMALLQAVGRNLKRYSMLKQEPEHHSDVVSRERSYKRFSFSGTLKRIKSNCFIEEAFSVSNATRDRSLVGGNPLVLRESQQNDRHAPYWKYHVLRYGRDLYLTTNPDTEHLYCRNGPGFYVEVLYFDKLALPDPSLGFNLIFKDMTPSESLSRDAQNPVMVITKKPQYQGGYFAILIPKKLRLMKQAPFSVSQVSQTSLSHMLHFRTSTTLSLATSYNGLLIPKEIPSKYCPPGAAEVQLPRLNFEYKDFHNLRWNVGLIPRLRSLGIALKTRLWVLGLIGGRSNEETQSYYVGKRNVYFHQNYIVDGDDDGNSAALLYKESNPAAIHTDDDHTKFPPVLAVFRPNDQKLHKKISRHLKRNRLPGSSNYVLSKFRGRDMEEDLGVGLSVTKYFTGGDGLYYVQHPQDDTPDDDKLGWITVYEDDRVFGPDNTIMFDIVVGLTLAVGLHANE